MTDFFLFAASPEPTRHELLKTWGHMLGSIDWEQTALLGQVLTGQLWSYDDLEWAEPHGETQIGRIPPRFATALAGVRDDQLRQLGEAWRVQLGDGFDQESLARDVDGLRIEAREAIAQGGTLWLRIEP